MPAVRMMTFMPLAGPNSAVCICFKRCGLRGWRCAGRRLSASWAHQHTIAAGEREESSQRRANFVAAFFFDHLDEHDLAAADHFLDAVAFGVVAFGAAADGFFIVLQRFHAVLGGSFLSAVCAAGASSVSTVSSMDGVAIASGFRRRFDHRLGKISRVSGFRLL